METYLLSCVCVVLGIHNPRVNFYFFSHFRGVQIWSKSGVLITILEPSKETLLSVGGRIAFDGGLYDIWGCDLPILVNVGRKHQCFSKEPFFPFTMHVYNMFGQDTMDIGMIPIFFSGVGGINWLPPIGSLARSTFWIQGWWTRWGRGVVLTFTPTKSCQHKMYAT